ncbi:MAG: hypothetical protein ACE5G8_11460 [Anaerolineae bacterium]
MTALALASILFLSLTVLFGWAFWHLINDAKPFPSPTPTVHHVDLKDLPEKSDAPPEPVVKETPATSQLHIPPPIVSSRGGSKTGVVLSGMGHSWTFRRKLTPKRRHHWPRTDSSMDVR